MFPTVATVPDLAGVETPVGLTHLTTAEPPWVDDRWGQPLLISLGVRLVNTN